MKKYLIIMIIFLSACTQVDPGIVKTQTMESALATVKAGIVITPSPVKCNPEEIKSVVNQLDGIINGGTAQPGTGDGQLTDEMRKQIVEYSDKTINQINAIPGVECLKPSISHLVNFYSIFKDVYSLENKASGTENMQKLFLASQEMELYKSGILAVTQ